MEVTGFLHWVTPSSPYPCPAAWHHFCILYKHRILHLHLHRLRVVSASSISHRERNACTTVYGIRASTHILPTMASNAPNLQKPAAQRDAHCPSAANEIDTTTMDCHKCMDTIGQPREDGSVESATTTACGHTFGDACLTRWLSTAITCPICRSPLREPRQVAEHRLIVELDPSNAELYDGLLGSSRCKFPSHSLCAETSLLTPSPAVENHMMPVSITPLPARNFPADFINNDDIGQPTAAPTTGTECDITILGDVIFLPWWRGAHQVAGSSACIAAITSMP